MNQMKPTYLPALSAQLSARLITPAAAAAIAFSLGAFTAPAWALGLSKITVKSHIGEPLHAEVRVIALKPQEEESLAARIADPSTFSSTGMRYSNALSGARVTLEKRGGSTYLKIKGYKPVQEPFMDLVLNVRSSKGGLVRGYTMLIDPITKPAGVAPVVPAPQPVASATTAPAAATHTAPPVTAQARPSDPSVMHLDDGSVLHLNTGTVESAAQPPQAGASQRAAASQPPAYTRKAGKRKTGKRRSSRSAIGKKTLGKDVRVVRGDTASELAVRNARAAGVSLDQMLAAMLQENSDAFINGDINRLKAGVVLNMPTQSTAQSISRSEARQILASSSNFRSYRRNLAASSAVGKTPAQERKTSGKVTSAVTDRSEAASQDRLTLSKTTAETGKASTGKPSREETAAAATQQQSAETRVAELEKNLQELQKLRESSQKATEAPAPAATPSDKPEDSIPELPGIKVPVSGDMVKAEIADGTQAAADAAGQLTQDTPEILIDAEPEIADAVTTPAENAVEQAKEAVQDAIPEIETPPVEANIPEPQPAAEPEKGIMGTVMDNIVPIGGGLLALLAAAGAFVFLRRRKQNSDGGDSAFIESRIGPDSFFDASGGQSIDTASRPNGVVSSSMVYSPSQLDAGGDVDPVAEADVYLAYNRDVQAEEILKEAMRITPSRVAIYTKLMEIYAQRGDVKAFDVVAREAHHLTGGQGDEWEKAVELGQKIDPQNPLYQGGGSDAMPGMAGSLNDNWEDKPTPFATATAPMAIDPMTTNSAPAELTGGTAQPDSMDLDLGDAFGQAGSSGSTPLEIPADMAYTEASLSGGAPLTASSAPAPISAGAGGGGADISFDLTNSLDAAGDDLADSFSANTTQPLATDLSTAGGAEEGISLDLADQTGNSTLGVDFGDPSPSLPAQSDGVPSVLDFSDSDTAASLLSPESTGDGTSLETKLMLAEEFKTLGDSDGARMMAQEVADNASGALKTQAEKFIASL